MSDVELAILGLQNIPELLEKIHKWLLIMGWTGFVMFVTIVVCFSSLENKLKEIKICIANNSRVILAECRENVRVMHGLRQR